MKTKTFLSTLFVGIFLLYSCGGNKQRGTVSLDKNPIIAKRTVNLNGETLITCDLSLVKDTIDLPMSFFISNFELIRLDDNDDALIKENSGDRVSLSENYIGIASSTGYKLFDRKNGNYISTLAQRGQGPNEFLISIYDSYIDEKNNRAYMLPMIGSSIIVSDLQGNVQSPIPLAYRVTKGRFRIDVEKKIVSIAILPFQGASAVVWIQDFDGNIIQEIAPGHLALAPDFSNEINVFQNTGQFDFSLFHWIAKNDTLYHYTESDNRLQPVFTLTFNENNIPQHDYIELRDYYIVRLIETEPAYRYLHILLDKETLRGSFFRLKLDMLGSIDASDFLVFNKGYYVDNVYAFQLKERLESARNSQKLSEKMKEYIQHLSDNIDEDDNNVILIGKLK